MTLNIISHHQQGLGIRLMNSNDNIINKNDITDSYWGDIGLSHSDRNDIEENDISHSEDKFGIIFSYADDNNVVRQRWFFDEDKSDHIVSQ